jgi:hypothetical protein
MSIIKTVKPARIKIRNDRKRSWKSIQQTRDRKLARQNKYSV